MGPGERLGDYTILSQIGEGGMSVVYLAEQTSNGLRVVVKQLKDEYRFNPQLVERFRREATILRDLRHPNLARVFDVLERDGKQYMIQEYLSGGSLADLLNRKQKYSERDAIRWCCDALRAMNYAHENVTVHRDLKPNNLMLDDKGRVRVIDFGIARAFGETRITRTADASMGTLEYMSPEQIATPHEIDHLTDVYSMGVVLYELLTGAAPFQGPTPFSIQEKIIRQPPPPLRQLGPCVEPIRPGQQAVDSQLARIIMRAVEKDPARRFGGCAEFALELERYVARQEAIARRKSDPGSRAPNVHPVGGATRGQRVAAVVALLVVLGAGGWVWFSGADAGESAATRVELDASPVDPARDGSDSVPVSPPARPASDDDLRPVPTTLPADPLVRDGAGTGGRATSGNLPSRRADAPRQPPVAPAELQLPPAADPLDEARRDAERRESERREAERREAERREQERLAALKKDADAKAAAARERQRLDEEAAARARADEEQRRREADLRLQQQREAERQQQERAQEAAERFAAAVLGTWVHQQDERTEEFRTRTEDVLTIAAGCSGVLTRTVTTYKRTFAGWDSTGSETRRLTFRCDASGRVTGDINGQFSLKGTSLILGGTTFARPR